MSAYRKFFTDEEFELVQRLVTQMNAVANSEPRDKCKINNSETFERIVRTVLMCGFDITDCSVVIEMNDEE